MDGVERRLAAILSADVVGYSKLMAADAQSTVRTITAYRTEIANLVGDHRGRVVDATGDSALAEFPTALDAVEAAVEIQRVLKARNAGLPEDRRMEFRIGVHMGDVIVEGDRIYGDGVNIAARLQGLADPGGICISGAVNEQVDSKLGLRSDDLGEQEVKNVPRKVRVFRVPADAPSAPMVTGSRGTDRPSIAVLPFADMSPEKDQEYFCDGMAEEVINALTQLEDLHVVARTSAFSFKGRDVDIREIGDKLGVRSVLEGSVRKAGDRLRVTAQLINVADGYHLWSDRFDRRLDDVFTIQDEISASIVDTLKVKLAVGTSATRAKRTVGQEAYDQYLRGMHHRWLQTDKDLRRALECFEQAVGVDSAFAGAHAGVALVSSLLGAYGLMAREPLLARGEAAALRAIELDESLGEAHDALGFLRGWLKWDWDGAGTALRRAIELNPGDASARLHYANSYLISTGRTSEGLAEVRTAHELDPFSLVINRGLGEALYYHRRFDDAVQQLRYVLEMAPDFPLARVLLVRAYASNDMPEEALHERQEILRRSGREEEAQKLETSFTQFGEPGILRSEIERGLPRAEKARAENSGGHPAFNLALLYARLGEEGEALDWLEEAVRQPKGGGIYVKVHPWLDNLHSDPRFGEILRKMNLVD